MTVETSSGVKEHHATDNLQVMMLSSKTCVTNRVEKKEDLDQQRMTKEHSYMCL